MADNQNNQNNQNTSMSSSVPGRGSDQGAGGIQVQSLNLASGGGSIAGLSGPLAVDSFSGSASVSLSLPLVPWRGSAPSLGLSYSSGLGNGPWGMGVGLGISSIGRRTSREVPRYTSDDVFVLSGADYLVPVNDGIRTQTLETGESSITYTIQTYQPCTEAAFALIEYWQAQSNSFWRVIDKSHGIYLFGYTAQARLINPNNPAQIAEWLLEERYDTIGQHELYDYKTEDNVNVPLTLQRPFTTQVYLQSVRYGNNTPVADSMLWTNDAAVTDRSQWHFELVVDYGEYDTTLPDPYTPVNDWACRPDPFSGYRFGFEVRTYRRCVQTLLFQRFKELPPSTDSTLLPSLTRGVLYTYTIDSASQLSFLQSAQPIGYRYQDGTSPYDTQTLPATQLSYQAFTPILSQFEAIERSDQGIVAGMDRFPNYHLVDLWGEGMPGILYADGQSTTYQDRVETDSLTYSPPQNLTRFPINRQVSGPMTLMDVDADGQLEAVVVTGNTRGYFSTEGLSRDWQHFTPFESTPSDPHGDQQQWVDVSGNGQADIIQLDRQAKQTKQTIRVYPSQGKAGWGSPYYTAAPLTFPESLQNRDPQQLILFADMVGGGLSQLVQIRNGSVTYWPSLGYGQFGEAVQLQNVPFFDTPEQFNPARLFVVDVDGSGASDIVYVHPHKATLYVNQSGNQLSDPIDIGLPVTIDSIDQINFVDLYGQGTTGVLLTIPNGPHRIPQYYYADLCQRQKPYLLTTLDNQQGAKTQIAYSSSAQYYLADKLAGQPWQTLLPFPISVVSQITLTEAWSNSSATQIYRYHEGYYDGVEREFRGFGCVERQDGEVFTHEGPDVIADNYVAPSLTKTWYSVGAPSPTLTQSYQGQYYAGDSEAFSLPDSHFIDLTTDQPAPIPSASIDPLTYAQVFRALKGRVLRTEVYGIDDTDLTHIPYAVSESNYAINVIQPKADNPYAIFYVYAEEALSYHYERDPTDPTISHTLNLQVDGYGNLERASSINYPRRSVSGALAAQQALHVYLSQNHFITAEIDPDSYLIGVPYESQSYYLPTLTPPTSGAFIIDSLRTTVNTYLTALTPEVPTSSNATLYSWQRMYYAQVTETTLDDITTPVTIPLALGTVQLPVLVYEQTQAAMTQSDLDTLFDGTAISGDLTTLLSVPWGNWNDSESPETTDTYWWTPGNIPSYGLASDFYMTQSVTDPANQTTTYEYDAYQAFLVKVIDPLGNVSQIDHTTSGDDMTPYCIDYRLLTPYRLLDSNQNTSEVSFDLLGRVIYSSYYGTQGGSSTVIGFDPVDTAPTAVPTDLTDLIDNAGTYIGNMAHYYYYQDVADFANQQPVYVAHVQSTRYPADSSDNQLQLQIGYVDGLGRSLQTKVLTDPEESPGCFVYDSETNTVTWDPASTATQRWLTSGATVYNNKGAPVRQYFPFYLNIPDYLNIADYITTPILDSFGVSSTLYYDPLNRVYQTLSPKGFYTKTTWTAWDQTAYDANDCIIDSPYYIANNPSTPPPPIDDPYHDPDILPEEQAALAYAKTHYQDTPSQLIWDNRGLAIQTIVNNAYFNDDDPPVRVDQFRTSETVYDAIGRVLTVQDARFYEDSPSVKNFTNAYGQLAGPAFKVISVDAGTRWVLPNVFGNPIVTIDSRDTTIYSGYDELQRPLWRCLSQPTLEDDVLTPASPVTQYLIYGESETSPSDHLNLRGQLYQRYDEAGLVTTGSFSILGQPLTSVHRLLIDFQHEVAWPADPTDRLDLLDATHYTAATTDDAIGRVLTATDVSGNVTTPSYYLSGRVSSTSVEVAIDSTTIDYISEITYNANGQRLSSTAGNGMVTTYTYETTTWRLRQVTTPTVSDSSVAYQTLIYEYDPVGNIVAKEDDSQDTTYYANTVVSPQFLYTYDALYQLIQAQGREGTGARDDWAATQTYQEYYSYDWGGNMQSRQHVVDTTSTTVSYAISNSTNRSVVDPDPTTTPIDPTVVDDYFDANGNLIYPATLYNDPSLTWDYRNQLQSMITVARDDDENDAEYYVYDGSGQRTRKVNIQYNSGLTNYTQIDTRYFGSIQIRQTSTIVVATGAQTITEEYQTLNLQDGGETVATRYDWSTGAPTPPPMPIPPYVQNTMVVYHLRDVLGSVSIDIDQDGYQICREEYYPYGGTALLQAIDNYDALRIYRYSGKEKDSTGFYYYGARYYAPWLCRWLNPDPSGPVDGLNVYGFVSNNPISYFDSNGRWQQDQWLGVADEKGGWKGTREGQMSENKKFFVPYDIKKKQPGANKNIYVNQDVHNLLQNEQKAEGLIHRSEGVWSFKKNTLTAFEAGAEVTYYEYTSTRLYPKDCIKTAEEVAAGSILENGEGMPYENSTTKIISPEEGAGKIFGNDEEWDQGFSDDFKSRKTEEDLAVYNRGIDPKPGQMLIKVWGEGSKSKSPYHAVAVVAKDGKDIITFEQSAGNKDAEDIAPASPYFDSYTVGDEKYSFSDRLARQYTGVVILAEPAVVVGQKKPDGFANMPDLPQNAEHRERNSKLKGTIKNRFNTMHSTSGKRIKTGK